MSEEEKPKGYGTLTFLLAMLLLLAAAGAYLYQIGPYVPTLRSTEARLLFNGEVMATFPRSDEGEVREGLQAMTVVNGYGKREFPGIVRMIHREDDGGTTVMIRLQEMPTEVEPPVRCKVAVKLPKPAGR